jgi:hypothetical protein
MTQQPQSRWSLDSTGNRVLLAVVVGLVVSFIGRQLDLIHGAVDVLVFVLVFALTYVAVTKLRS